MQRKFLTVIFTRVSPTVYSAFTVCVMNTSRYLKWLWIKLKPRILAQHSVQRFARIQSNRRNDQNAEHKNKSSLHCTRTVFAVESTTNARRQTQTYHIFAAGHGAGQRSSDITRRTLVVANRNRRSPEQSQQSTDPLQKGPDFGHQDIIHC